MQLGELQHQIERFQRRSASIVGLSVDKPKDSEAMLRRMGIGFALGSDPDQAVIRAFKVQNPDTQELALHAVYIVNNDKQVIYRKVGRRRPTSNELIDAIDAYQGNYPQSDSAKPPRRVDVAYPTNNFEALLALQATVGLSENIDQERYQVLRAMPQLVHNDDALVAVRDLMEGSIKASKEDLLSLAAHLAQVAFYPNDHPALREAVNLRSRLDNVQLLERRLDESKDDDARDKLLGQLSNARARLTRTRAIISDNAQTWRLRSLKTAIRSYREVALAAVRNRS